MQKKGRKTKQNQQKNKASHNDLVEAGRENLLSFCSLVDRTYQTPEHICKIARALEMVEAGKIKRLIISMPPRHGKSMLTSQMFPAWYLGRNPSKYIISATYGQELSNDFGSAVRDLMQDPYFIQFFPEVRLRKDVNAQNRFKTNKRGVYFGVGIGGAVTGRGAHLLIIDDPVKNKEEANSKTMRDRHWNWYKTVARTRLQPGAAQIIIMTRWDEDDLVGRLIEAEGEKWVELKLRAIDDENKPLWPEAYNLEALNEIRELDEYVFSALYQQEPIPEKGIIIKKDWIQKGIYDDLSKYAAIYAAVDPAISEKDHADETAIVVGGMTYDDPSQIHEIATYHGHWDFDRQVEMIRFIHKTFGAAMIGIEDVAYQKALIQYCVKRGLPIFPIKAIKDKVARAMSVQHYFSQGRVRINTLETAKQLLGFRGKDERNDIADAVFHLIGIVRDFSIDRFEKKKDPYKGMSPAEASARSFFDKAMEYERNQLLRDQNSVEEEIFDSTNLVVSDSNFY